MLRQNLESHVVVKEKPGKPGVTQSVTLEGLTCANCAARIETQAQDVAGVKNVWVDFVAKKLTVEVAEKQELQRVLGDVSRVVATIEPDVKVVVDAPAGKSKNEADEGAARRNREIAKLVAGGALLAVAVIFTFPDLVELILFLISYAIVGGSVVIRALRGIRRGQVFSEHFLMSVATIGAFFVGEYPEAVAVMLFYLVGELFQDMAVDHSRKSISDLMDIRPDYANLIVAGETKRVHPDDVQIDDRIVVRPGERVPLDGIVVAGTSTVDTAALTGESMPRELEPGSPILSGFVNKNGVLTVKVTKDFADSTVSKILDLVQNASSRKAPTEKFITKFARYYTPVVVYAALALAIVPPLVVPGATFSEWIYRALVFLVVSCPCALVISIPLGFFGGIGGASKRGILVKGSNYLEALNSVETVVFDKTGTLTKGEFEVTEVVARCTFSGTQVLEFAAYAECHSTHPIALSILKNYRQVINPGKIETYKEVAGQGIRAIVNDKEILAGNPKLMVAHNIRYDDVEAIGTVVHIAVDRTYAGYIVIADEVKADAASAISELKSIGVDKTVMLTGDLKAVGEKIGRHLGLDEVYTELLPSDKVDVIEALEAKKSGSGKIVFVGDGINDAPVLARSDVGIAMGGLGSDAAIEAADVVIMTDEPSKVATAIKIAKRTRRIVVENIIFALGIKAVFLVLGAWGLASMWEAVFADMGVALIAIFNAMRAMNTKAL